METQVGRQPLYTIYCEDRPFRVESPSLTDLMTQNYWARGIFYEGKLLQFIRGMQLQGTYVDCGANLGNHSIFFANFCQPSRLLSVEAVPAIYDLMVRNVRRNLPDDVNFEPANWALYHRSSWVAEFNPPSPQNLGGTEMRIRPRNVNDTVTGLKANTVHTMPLDELIQPDEHVAVIKMDLEGSEPMALVGAAATIVRCRPLLVIEANRPGMLATLDSLVDGFQLGYRRLAATPKKLTYLWQVP
jgi:FkbM family methyltransferase